MQLTTAMHLIVLIVPIVVLALFDLVDVKPSGALLGALGTLSAYAGTSSLIGFTKDRILLRRTQAELAARDELAQREEDAPAQPTVRLQSKTHVGQAGEGGG